MSGGITIDKQKDIDGDKVILEDTDGDTANITSGGKLEVAASLSQIPPNKVAYQDMTAKNGGSDDMTVDGSGSTVTFTIGPSAGDIWYVYELGILIEDSGNNTINNFGAITNGLTNGVIIRQYINSTNYDFRTITNNLELVESFTDHSFRGTANAFLNAVNFFTGKVELRDPVTLNGDDGDEIRILIQDDLTGLNQFKFNVEYFKVL